MFGEVLSFIGNILDGLCTICFSAATVPFITDQLIGATADELSALVYWYLWFVYLSMGLASCTLCTVTSLDFSPLYILAVPCEACLAMIIISDCLCRQWLDRTHKVTNPIKLIIQVLNYPRKNKYPQRRSAFTYLDEEQPSRLDYGKEKFGGPLIHWRGGTGCQNYSSAIATIVACISISLGVKWPIIYISVVENQWPNYYA